MAAQIEMNTQVTELIVESQETVKQKKFISKREGLDHLVFGYWFIHQLELDEVTKAKAMNKLRLYDGYEIQHEFMGCFMDDYKTIEKEVTKNINNHFKPVKEKKEKKLVDGEKPKRGRPKVEKKDNRSEQEKLIDQIIKASQTEPSQSVVEPAVPEIVEPAVPEVVEPAVPEVAKTPVKAKKQTVPRKPKKEKKSKFVEPAGPINLNDSFELVEESYDINSGDIA